MKTVKLHICSSFQKEGKKKKKMEVFRCYIQVQLHKIYIGSLPSQKNHLSLSLPNIYILDVIALKTLSYGKSIYEIVMRDYALPLHKRHKDNFSYNFLQ